MNGVSLYPLDQERLEAASQWWARLQEPDVSAEDLSAWLEWIEADADNREAYERIQELTQRLRATGEQRASTQRRASPMKWAAAAMVVLAVAAVSVSQLRPEPPRATMAFSTPVAGSGQAPLPDGSKVSLGGATSIEAVYSAASRDIRLKEGEAFFEVHHERGPRAFVVKSGSISIRAVGTAFNVRKTGERVTVTVTEGKVKIGRADGSASILDGMVEAGQQATYDPASNRLSVVTRGQEAERALAWREQKLVFSDDPLDAVIANVNRYSPRHIEVRNLDLHEHSYTGTFQPDRLDEWLIAIERSFPVTIRTSDDAVVIEPRK